MTTTPTSGAAIQRYKIGYHADEWGQRSSTPSGIPDASGSWVRYADHVTALAAGQAKAAQSGLTDAYVGAREDLSIWKRRALEAEATVRNFVREANSPTFMGDPAAHVGDSLFESWFSEYNPAHRGTKQQMRDAYAAGMGDPKAQTSPTPHGQVPVVHGDALSDAVRVPLDSLHADAAYLIGRLRDGSMPYVRVIEIIRERIDAASPKAQAAPTNPHWDYLKRYWQMGFDGVSLDACTGDAPIKAWHEGKAARASATPAAQAAQADSVQEDAARYRWLRAPTTDVALVLDKRTEWVPPDDVVPGVGGYCVYEYRAGDELDAAVDAAMNKGGSA